MATPQAAASENFTDFVRQKVESLTSDKTLFELKAPNYNAIKKYTKTEPITAKGYRIPWWDKMPGGVGGFLPSDSSFNDYVAPTSQSMYVFPTYMAQPMIYQGDTIRMLKGGNESTVQNLGDSINLHYTVFLKRIEQMVLGDGSGTLAVSSSTITTLGTGQTMNCTTAAATTAGQTKGARRLRKGHFFDAINPSTGLVRGQFYVEVPGAASCTIFLLSGSISSGDLITDPGSYNRMPRGLAHLVSNASRVLQTLDTSTNSDLNAAAVDLNGTLATPSTFDAVKTALQMRNNDQDSENKLLCFCTYNFYSILKRQGWNLAIQPTDRTVGIARRYVEGDTTFILSTDMDDDRAYLVNADSIVMFEEMPLGDFDLDKQEWRMLLGNNGTGSDAWQRALGICFNLGVTRPIGTAFIKRALTTGTQTEVLSNS